MKRLIIYSSILLLGLTACDKKLEIDPQANINEDLVFTTEANLKKALIGAYDAVSSGAALGGDMQMYSELLAAERVGGEIRFVGTFNQPDEIFQKSMLTNNSYIAATWAAAYRAINICNNILAHLDLVKDQNERGVVEGEAKFLRGTMYFELVKLYAKPYSTGQSTPGVQLVTTPTEGDVTDANFVARSTVAQTYDLIVADLESAKSLLPIRNDVYATTVAASAQLSRVYLQMLNYTKARDEANRALTTGLANSYDLTTFYDEAFNNQENSSEDLFAIQVNSQDGANDLHLFWSIQDFGARDGDIDVLAKHLALYAGSTADDRFNLFYKDGNVWRSGKWLLQYRNIPVIRLAEMYLTRAEANFRLGTTLGATPLEDVRTIRARAGLSTVAGYITLNNIILERKLELAHEGQAIHDLRRLGRQIGTNMPSDADNTILPIPIREVNASNGSLKQNPGY